MTIESIKELIEYAKAEISQHDRLYVGTGRHVLEVFEKYIEDTEREKHICLRCENDKPTYPLCIDCIKEIIVTV